jgi:aldose 1-epimerase
MSTNPVWPAGLARVSLHAGDTTLELAPAIGGAIAAYYSIHEGARFDWLRPASTAALEARLPVGMASYPLIPFCNRIRHGRFTIRDRGVALPLNVAEPHVLHGFAWQRAWQCTAESTSEATLRMEHAGGDWPWPFVAEQTYRLEGNALHVEMKVINRSDEAMPIGIGHHPYVLHRPGTRLQVDVESMWEGDDEVMPTQLSQPSFLDDLRRGTLLAPIVRDNNFIGWQHSARVEWPQEQMQMTLMAESPLDFFVLYSPDDKDHFCIEGVSNCTDWLNLRHLPLAQIGGHVLAPGEALRARFSLQPGMLHSDN